KAEADRVRRIENNRKAANEYSRPRTAYTPATPAAAPGPQVTPTHNVVRDGRKGVLFNLKYQVDGAKGKPCVAVVWFYGADGKPLQAADRAYSAGGSACALVPITPLYDHAAFTGALFMPYDAIRPAPGRHEVRFRFVVWCDELKTWPTRQSGTTSFTLKDGT